MYRSWAYILMIVATLVGVVALLWPSPTVHTIAQVAPAPREAAPARAEAPAKAAKAAAKAAPAKAAAKPAAPPPPPPVVSHMPSASTLAKRATPQLQNGMGPNLFGRPVGEVPNVTPPPTPPPPPGQRPGAPASARPILPSRPSPEAAK